MRQRHNFFKKWLFCIECRQVFKILAVSQTECRASVDPKPELLFQAINYKWFYPILQRFIIIIIEVFASSDKPQGADSSKIKFIIKKEKGCLKHPLVLSIIFYLVSNPKAL